MLVSLRNARGEAAEVGTAGSDLGCEPGKAQLTTSILIRREGRMKKGRGRGDDGPKLSRKKEQGEDEEAFLLFVPSTLPRYFDPYLPCVSEKNRLRTASGY
jgi:hypothetical protein